MKKLFLSIMGEKMNPFSIWTGMQAKTKMTIIIVLGVIVVTSMLTGNFSELIAIFKN